MPNLVLLRASPPGGADHTSGKSKSALVAGMVMMMRCHHSSLTMMHCCQVDILPLRLTLADEVA